MPQPEETEQKNNIDLSINNAVCCFVFILAKLLLVIFCHE